MGCTQGSGEVGSPPQLGRVTTGEQSFDALLERVDAERTSLSETLLTSGVLLIRGYPVDTVEQFAELVSALAVGRDLKEYRGGASPRSPLQGGKQPVYNSTEYPPQIELALHNELSYSADYPSRVYFLCLTAPEEGGETTFADSRRILERMPTEVRAQFERSGIRYIRNLPSGKGSGYSWQDAFGSDDKEEVERRCGDAGAEVEWLARGNLRIVQTRPATIVHPETGDEVWFNQAAGFHPSGLDPDTYTELMDRCGSEEHFRLNAQFGDGTPMPIETLKAVRQVVSQESRGHTWKRGDVLVLDNLLTAHGRRPFRGPRLIATAMS